MSLCNTSLTIQEIDELFTHSSKIFFIGIGGVSMSAMAEFCAVLGKEVHGYDRQRNNSTIRLEKKAKIKYTSTPDNVKGMDLVVYTGAIDEKNYEYRQAKKMGLPLISRANFLGYIISMHKLGIGVCGSHGKTTTTALLGHIFYTAEENPTVFAGGEMNNFHANFQFGGRTCCIFESCEYRNSFLSLPTTCAVVLNVDYDHPDFFESIEDVKSSFQKYVSGAERVFLNSDDKHARELCHKSTVTFGFNEPATYRGQIINQDQDGTKFAVYKKGSYLCECHIPLCGKHASLDALCAVCVAHTCGIPIDKIILAISSFQGVRRRQEFLGKSDTGADIFEDYGHHPTEIQSSLTAFSHMGYKKVLCIFQPHTFSRTYFLYEHFISAFSSSSELIVAPTFSAREENVFELSEERFATDCGGKYISDFEQIRKAVLFTSCDCVVLMGAGDLKDKLGLFE